MFIFFISNKRYQLDGIYINSRTANDAISSFQKLKIKSENCFYYFFDKQIFYLGNIWDFEYTNNSTWYTGKGNFNQ